jgi:glycosyltransferase involved in cell wall biosynthesis
MTSVVVAAHNEAAVIERCLTSLVTPGVQVIVAANGCTDDTAAIARRRPGVRVIELATASKVAALNAGDVVATGYPRLYVDADVVLSPGAVEQLCNALARPGALVAVPKRRLVLAGRPLAVRAYYAIHSRLPVFYNGLFGRGVIALSEAGRRRFDRFPEVLADDLFLDSLFSPTERTIVPTVSVAVHTPTRTRDLVRRLVRVRAGNSTLRAATTGAGNAAGASPGGVRRSDNWSWLRDVVLPSPWLAPAAVVYVALTVTAQLRARRVRGRAGAHVWHRDDSSRADAARERGRVAGHG